MSFVEPQELATCWQIVVNDIENLAVNAFGDARQENRVRTVVHIREWHDIPRAEVEEDAECCSTDPSRDSGMAWPVHGAGAYHDIRHGMLPAVFDDKVLLLHLGEAICLTPKSRPRLGRTRFV